jgi:hypothetical protein
MIIAGDLFTFHAFGSVALTLDRNAKEPVSAQPGIFTVYTLVYARIGSGIDDIAIRRVDC